MTAELRTVSRRITADFIRGYCALTNDPNPLHLDPDFAATTEMGGIIAPGTLSLNLVWQAVALTFGADEVGGCVLDVRFVAPVRLDDVITAGGRALPDDESVFEVWAVNQRGEPAITGRLTRRHERA